MKKFTLFLAPLFLLAEPPTLNLIGDLYYSPYTGAESLLTLSQGIQYVENWAVKKPNPPHRGWTPSLERLGELLLCWEPYNYMSGVVQHEVFGHGYRARSFRKEGVRVRKYKFGFPPPFGPGGGVTYLSFQPQRLTPFQLSAMSSAGVEATSILAIRLKLQWLQAGCINPSQASLYQYSQHDLTHYILATKDKVSYQGIADSEGDIQSYVHILHATLPKGHLTTHQIRRWALINYAEPFTYYAFYAWWLYLITGKQMDIPLFSMGSYGYLPGLRMGLTPFGPEYYVENFLVQDKKPIYFYLRGGRYAGLSSCGLGIEHAYIGSVDGVPWGFRADVWYQPNVPYKAHASTNLLTFDYAKQQHYKNRFGGAISLLGHIKISNGSALFLQLGGKTTGFLPGETLTPSVILRLGFSFF